MIKTSLINQKIHYKIEYLISVKKYILPATAAAPTTAGEDAIFILVPVDAPLANVEVGVAVVDKFNSIQFNKIKFILKNLLELLHLLMQHL